MNSMFFRSGLRRGASALLLFLMVLLCGSAHAARHALLVGVSELANQPKKDWLHAPGNDVQLMRRTLLRQGWEASQVRVLADGVPGAELPEAGAIRNALWQLLDQVRSGDLVLLYFSGHGTRVRNPDKSYQEPDGLAELFLARDARGLGGRASTTSTIEGGLEDVEFERWINEFLAREAFVWAVFDTCSATSMTRGASGSDEHRSDDPVRFRGLQSSVIAASTMAEAPVVTQLPAAAPVPRARYVAFFASESHQVTPELKLPRGDRGARMQGLLTWAITESLQRQPTTWRELFNGVLSAYAPVVDELEQRFPSRDLPSPVAEGALDGPLFSDTSTVAWTLPSWPAFRSGSALELTQGRVDGLTQGQVLRLTAWLDRGQTRSATAHVDQLGLTSARVALPVALAHLPEGTTWTVAPTAAPESLALPVQAASDALQGLSLEYPASVRQAARADALIAVDALPGGGYQVQDHADNRRHRFHSRKDLHEYLQGRASLHWMADILKQAAPSQLPGVDVELLQLDARGRVLQQEPLAAHPRLQRSADASKLALQVSNTSKRSIDLLILGLDGSGQRHPIYPSSAGETNRFESGSRALPAAKRFDLPPSVADPGGELVVIAVPARPHSASRLYGLSPQAVPVDSLRRRGGAAPRADEVLAIHAHW